MTGYLSFFSINMMNIIIIMMMVNIKQQHFRLPVGKYVP